MIINNEDGVTTISYENFKKEHDDVVLYDGQQLVITFGNE